MSPASVSSPVKKRGVGLNHPLLGHDSVILLLSQLERLVFQRWPAFPPGTLCPSLTGSALSRTQHQRDEGVYVLLRTSCVPGAQCALRPLVEFLPVISVLLGKHPERRGDFLRC